MKQLRGYEISTLVRTRDHSGFTIANNQTSSLGGRVTALAEVHNSLRVLLFVPDENGKLVRREE